MLPLDYDNGLQGRDAMKFVRRTAGLAAKSRTRRLLDTS
jgi:hypothetical protein